VLFVTIVRKDEEVRFQCRVQQTKMIEMNWKF